MSIENPLEVWRVGKGLTSVEAAKALEVSRGHYYAIAKGQSLPQSALATRIQAVTGVTRGELANWMNEQQVAS